ncbi:MAG TPA: SDR family oxidoreductase, partial [Anaerolineales bacterium]
MRRVVITGSTRGLGYGMAEAFLRAGCAVMVSGRNPGAVDQAVSNLTARLGAANVAGQACDVTVFEQLQALWAAAQARWGGVDIWINNAGISSGDLPLLELLPSLIRTVVETNLTGALLGSQVAAAG